MSKHAIEAYTDSLASELDSFGVEISAVEPGNYNSQTGNGVAEKLANAPYAQPSEPLAEYLAKYADYLSNRSQFKEHDEVADAVLHGFFDNNSKRRYMVVPNQDEANITIRQTMRELIQLNTGKPYSSSRDDLIKMLDDISAEVSEN